MDVHTLSKEISNSSLSDIEKFLSDLKTTDLKLFKSYISRLKVCFLLYDDILLLNKISLVFSTFKIHSSVPLIISKLLNGKHNIEGGTLLFALEGLKRNDFKEELIELSTREISYEMRSILEDWGIGI